jgi:hypothetical protein
MRPIGSWTSFSGAVHKKFRNKEEADAFIQDSTIGPFLALARPSRHPLITPPSSCQ